MVLSICWIVWFFTLVRVPSSVDFAHAERSKDPKDKIPRVEFALNKSSLFVQSFHEEKYQ